MPEKLNEHLHFTEQKKKDPKDKEISPESQMHL